MENASKALLIAGAILLVTALIAIAVAFIGRAEQPLDIAGNKLDATSIKMHNNKFSKYSGEVRGSEVKACISTVLANNNSDNKIIDVKAKVDNKSTSDITINNSTTSVRSDAISNNSIYIGTPSINSDGIITDITFKEQ